MRRIKQLLTDDDSAVSPVIGVILMVAITVILAAVIASFVLGLGDQADDVSPNIVFDSDFDNSTGEATITISTADGDADPDTIYLRGGALDDADGDTWSDFDGEDASAGESITIDDWQDADIGGEDITIVFETDDTSDTLDTITIPDDFDGESIN